MILGSNPIQSILFFLKSSLSFQFGAKALNSNFTKSKPEGIKDIDITPGISVFFN